ncbi:hypothetical protein EWM64_g7668 [Hericium alpestre]|uniref:Uncharacterized protein n=1 Tax=Hericium alpestre TaxID=135208 RepID=A0A4Y9ZQL0_9AGAM|nr:hypothetical protein EWM64_g7668 [Hericium alpestre]
MFTILQPLPPDPLLASVMQCPLDFKEECAFRQLLLSIIDNFPPIDKLTDFNYTTWARDCAEDQLILSTFIRWAEQDLYITKLILSHVSDSERMRVEQQCRGYTSSSDLWHSMRRLYLHPDTIANSKAIYFLPAKPIRAACLHCNRSNHSSDNCWQKFGKPEWLRIKERGRKAAPAPGNRSSLSTPSAQANTAMVVEICGIALDNSINSSHAL